MQTDLYSGHTRIFYRILLCWILLRNVFFVSYYCYSKGSVMKKMKFRFLFCMVVEHTNIIIKIWSFKCAKTSQEVHTYNNDNIMPIILSGIKYYVTFIVVVHISPSVSVEEVLHTHMCWKLEAVAIFHVTKKKW